MNLKRVMSKVFFWMFIGLMVTFATGFYVSTQENILYNIYENNIYWILFLLELVLVIVLSARVFKMKPMTAKIVFVLYSFVTGLTFSSIFVIFELSSIIYVFFIAAIVFGVFAGIGYFTKLDLMKMGTYLFMALLGVLVCIIVNLFLQNEMFDLVITCISLLVFIGFTAYDMKKIKEWSFQTEEEDSLAIMGALSLYLDFINIFLDLLRLFGKAKD